MAWIARRARADGSGPGRVASRLLAGWEASVAGRASDRRASRHQSCLPSSRLDQRGPTAVARGPASPVLSGPCVPISDTSWRRRPTTGRVPFRVPMLIVVGQGQQRGSGGLERCLARGRATSLPTVRDWGLTPCSRRGRTARCVLYVGNYKASSCRFACSRCCVHTVTACMYSGCTSASYAGVLAVEMCCWHIAQPGPSWMRSSTCARPNSASGTPAPTPLAPSLVVAGAPMRRNHRLQRAEQEADAPRTRGCAVTPPGNKGMVPPLPRAYFSPSPLYLPPSPRPCPQHLRLHRPKIGRPCCDGWRLSSIAASVSLDIKAPIKLTRLFALCPRQSNAT